MRFKTGSKHKFDEAALIPSQVLRGTLNTSKVAKMVTTANLSDLVKSLQLNEPKKSK